MEDEFYVARIVRELACADTGCNISMTNEATATRMNRRIEKWDVPKKIKFGNGTTNIATHYADFGRTLGRLTIVEGADMTLISIWDIASGGNGIYFDVDKMIIIDKTTGEELYRCPGDSTREQWNLDMREVIEQDKNRKTAKYHPDLRALAGTKDRSKGTHAVPRTGRRISKEMEAAIIWTHECLMHTASTGAMAAAIRSHAWEGLPTVGEDDITATMIEEVFSKNNCIACMLGKKNHDAAQQGSGVRSQTLGKVVSCDVSGEITPTGVGGWKRFYLFEEQSVGLPLVYLIKDIKGGFEPALRAADNWFKSRGFKIEILRYDASKFENSKENQALFADLNILGRPATVEEQRQNFVERRAQTVSKATSCTMIAQNLLGPRFWPLAVKATVFAMQAVPNKKSGDEAPIWYFEHKRPNIGDLMKFPFGTPVIISRTGVKEWKFSTNNVYGITVGPDTSGNGATQCLIPGKGITPFSRKHVSHLVIQTRKMTLADMEKKKAEQQITESNDDFEFHTPMTTDMGRDGNEELCVSPTGGLQLSDGTPTSNGIREAVDALNQEEHESDSNQSPQQDSEGATGFEFDPGGAQDSEGDKQQHWLRRSQRFNKAFYAKAEKSFNSTIYSTQGLPEWSRVFAARKVRTEANPTITKAMASEDTRILWAPTIRGEIRQMGPRELNVLKLLPKGQLPPHGFQIQAMICDLKTKFKEQLGIIVEDKKKCRLLVNGKLEWLQENEDNYAPTGQSKTLMMMFAVAVETGRKFRGIDIVGAFLAEAVKKDDTAFVEIPPLLMKYFSDEFQDYRQEGLGDGPKPIKELTAQESAELMHTSADRHNPYDRQVAKLLKSIYGRRRAPQVFNEGLDAHLTAHGYKRSGPDACAYYKELDGSGEPTDMFFTIAVDDFACFPREEKHFQELVQVLNKKYTTKVAENLNGHLGMKVNEYADGSVGLSQPKTLQAIFNLFDIADDDPGVETPMRVDFSDEEQDKGEKIDIETYRRPLGTIIHVLKTRGDIAYASGRLGSRQHRCTDKDLAALKHLARYLKRTQDYELTFTPSNREQAMEVIKVFGWSDHAHQVHTDGKGQTGTGLSIGNHDTGMFDTQSKKDTINVRSTTEGETGGGCRVTTGVIWARNMAAEWGYTMLEATTLYEDNQSMIKLCSKPSGNHQRTKHFTGDINFMLDNVRRGIIQLEYLKTEEMPVDILTKAKGPTAHQRCASRILGPQHGKAEGRTAKREVHFAKRVRVSEYETEDD